MLQGLKCQSLITGYRPILIIGVTLVILLEFIQEANAATKISFKLPNIKLVGGTYDELNATYETCLHKCGAAQCCVGFAYGQLEHRCYLKSAIDASEEDESWTSVLMANSNHGQKAILRNVLIDGARRFIDLPSAKDCHEYCTAFGMYSWTPAQREGNAHCQCIQRIRAIRYFFGALSSIFPSENHY